MSPRPITRCALAALLVAALPACSLLGGKKAPPTQYAPMPQVAAEASWPRVDAQLEIAPVQVARPYDTLRIAVRPSPQELEVYRDGLWAQRPAEMLTTSLLRTFQESGRLRAVSRSGSGVTAGYRLLLDVRRFESDYAGAATPGATLDVNATLLRSDGGDVIATRSFVVVEPAGATDVPTVVQAFDRALVRLDRDVAGWTLGAMAGARR
ncbi:ABC-type transport auxiliary lipoprotein family protein [Lysobacter xanthus]